MLETERGSTRSHSGGELALEMSCRKTDYVIMTSLCLPVYFSISHTYFPTYTSL